METKEIINEIKKLSVIERLQIIEKTAKTLQFEEEKLAIKKAAELLFNEYKDNTELTAFTALDL